MIDGTGEQKLTRRQTEMDETSDEGNGASGEFRDNGDRSGELGEMISQSDIGCGDSLKVVVE